MKLKSILNVYYDKELKMDIVKGKIINEVYEARGLELTEERAKVLVAAGVAAILEEAPKERKNKKNNNVENAEKPVEKVEEKSEEK